MLFRPVVLIGRLTGCADVRVTDSATVHARIHVSRVADE